MEACRNTPAIASSTPAASFRPATINVRRKRTRLHLGWPGGSSRPQQREGAKLQFPGEFFNARNHASFNNPNGTVNSPGFGAIGSPNPGRVTELVLRLFF